MEPRHREPSSSSSYPTAQDLIWDSIRSQAPAVLGFVEREQRARHAKWWGWRWRAIRALSLLLSWIWFHPGFIFLSATAAGWFLFLYQDPNMRANLEGEAWGVAGAGLAMWFVQELASEGIQRRAWLRRNVEYVDGVLTSLCAEANIILVLAKNLDPMTTPLPDSSAKERRQYAARAREVVAVPAWPSPTPEGDPRTTHYRRTTFAEKVAEIDRIVTENADLTGRISGLMAAVYRLRERHRLIDRFLERRSDGVPLDLTDSAALHDFASHALRIYEVCTAALEDSGALSWPYRLTHPPIRIARQQPAGTKEA